MFPKFYVDKKEEKEMDIKVLEGKKVLIVDDEPDIIEILAESLDMCQVDTAKDYLAGKKLLSHHSYDAVILDIMGVNGYGLLDVANERGIPAIILTAHALNAENFKKSIRAGACVYLPKEKMIDIDEYLAELITSHRKGEKKSGKWFARLAPFFNQAFGSDWKQADPDFDREFKELFVFTREELEEIL